MPSAKRTLEIYSELADLQDQRGDAQMRDRFLILAADAALTLGARDRAEHFRERLLEQNPHHLLRPYPSMPEALQSPDVAGYVADLRRAYPPAEAGRLLEELHSDDVGADEQARQVAALEEEEAPNEPAIVPFADAPPEPHAPKRRPPRPQRLEAAAEPETPEVFPYPSQVASSGLRPQDVDDEEAPAAAGAWLSSGLFGVVLLAGLALLVYTLARPFVPM